MTGSDAMFSTIDLELKVASKALIRDYGGQVAAEALLGRRQQHYSECGKPDQRAFLTLHEVAQLEDRTAGKVGHPIVTRELAARQGFGLVPIAAPLPQDADLLMLGAQVAKETGDVSGAICAAFADRRVCEDDADEIDRQVDELIAMAMRVKAVVRAIKAGEL